MSASRAAAAGLTAAIALGAGLSLAHVASAQDAAAPPSAPSPETLAKCAQLPSDEARLSCYDAAMRAAGFAPKPGEVAAEHRKHFGLPAPKLDILKHHNKEEGEAVVGQAGAVAAPPEENPDKVTVQVLRTASIAPTGKMLVVTDDGQIWEQTDTTEVTAMPAQGDSMGIRRGTLGGYFCAANKYQEVRCKRVR